MKPMVLISVLLFNSDVVCSQDTLYTSSENYFQQRYSLVKRKMALGSALKYQTVASSPAPLNTDSLFLLKTKNQIHRFIRQQQVTLFYRDSLICLYSYAKGNGFKNNPVVVTYFFSKQLHSPLYPFTLIHLINAYPQANPVLLGYLTASDTALVEWDERFNQPRIAFLLQQIN